MIDLTNFDSVFGCMIQTFIVVLILFLIFALVMYLNGRKGQNPVLISSVTPADKPISFTTDVIKTSQFDQGVTWSMVGWLYIDDWNYRFGQHKYILDWSDAAKNGIQIYFDKKENNLNIDITTIPIMKKEKLVFKDIPLQKWFNIIVILDNRSLDLFIDGVLVKTKKLEYVPLYKTNTLTLFPEGGFKGNVGYFQYMAYKLPQFAVQHFQLIKHKLNGDTPYYSPTIYSLLYGFKTALYMFILLIDRLFKYFNYFTFEIFFQFVDIVRDAIQDVVDIVMGLF